MKDRLGYTDETTRRCERALITLIGNIGPWSKRIYLAGGLAPLYIVGPLSDAASPHIGTTDVDMVIGLMIDDAVETYSTLQANLKKTGFKQTQLSYQWEREVDGVNVLVEFMCETDQVEPGSIHRPKQGTGSKVGAFNVPGAQLAVRDFTVHQVAGKRLDEGGLSTVELQVVGVLTFTVLKILAFQDRQENKDAYDLVYTLLNYPGGPAGAGRVAADTEIASLPQVVNALDLLQRRFETTDHDGPVAHATFLGDPQDTDADDRLRNEAVFTIRQFLEAFRSSH